MTAWSTTLHADGVVLSNDDRTVTGDADTSNSIGLADTEISTGEKVRIEVAVDAEGALAGVGIGNASTDLTEGSHIGDPGNNDIGWISDGRVFLNNVVIDTYATFDAGDVLDMDVDFDAGTVEFFKNGVSQAAPVSHGITGDLFAEYNVKNSTDMLSLVQPGAYTHDGEGFAEYGAEPEAETKPTNLYCSLVAVGQREGL